MGATILTLSSDTSIDIKAKEISVPSGNGSISGFIQFGMGSGKNGNNTLTPFGDPVPGVDISLEQIPGGIKQHTSSDNNGNYFLQIKTNVENSLPIKIILDLEH